MTSKIAPGLVVAAAVGLAARYTSGLITVRGTNPISDVTLAIIAGLTIRAALPTAVKVLAPGASFAVKRLLRWGIVLLGLGLSLGAVLGTGLSSLVIIVVAVTLALVVTRLLGKVAGCNDKLATLIAVGTGICGATAIVTAAPVIEADDDDVCYAIAVITVFGMLAIFVYPLIGALLALNESQFGVWAGVAIHDTAQVIAAGFAYGEQAARVATVVKLTRTALLAPLVLVLAAQHRRKSAQSGRLKLSGMFPWFIAGFVAMALLRTVGDALLSGTALADTWAASRYWLGYLARLLIVTAMAGVGLSTSFATFRQAGFKPLAIGLAASVLVGVVALVLIFSFGF